MKVLHVAETAVGGIATYLNYINEFNRSSIENIFLIPEDQKEHLSGDSYVFQRTGRNIYSILSMMLAFYKVYHENKPDIVHLHSSLAGLIRFMAILNPALKRKLVYCSHGWSFDMQDKSELAIKSYKIIERFLSILSSKIVCISEFECRGAHNIGINKDKLVVVYNCVSEDKSISKPLDLDLKEEHQYCIFVGRDSYQKGFDLLSGISLLLPKNMKLLVVGNLDAVQSDTDSIKYLGWRRQDEIRYLMSKSEFMICPSRWEGFGYVIVEAFKSSLPVIGSNRGAIPEIIRNMEDGMIFDIEDMSTLSTCINKIKDEKFKAKLKINVAKRYKDFSYEEFENSLTNVYLELKQK